MSKATTKDMPTEIHKAEILPERDLDSEINQSLVKANVTDAVIAGLKKKYGGMQLKNIDDKETYLEISEARKVVRKVGIIVEKITKAGREEAIAIQKKWLGKEKELIAKIEEVQNPLDAEIKKFDDNVARIEAEEKEKQEQQFMSRQTTLLKMEAVYSGNSFTLGNVSYEINNIKEADEEIWNDVILAKYKKEFEKAEAVRAEEERKQKEAADKLKADQDLLAQQKADYEKQMAEMQQQQRLLDEQKRQQEDLIRQEQQRKDDEVKEKKRQQDSQRINQVVSLGLKYNPQHNAYVYEDANVDVMTELNLFDEAQWNKLIEDITPVVAERKAAAAQKEADRIEKEKRDAIEIELQKERDRIAEQNRLAEIKRQQEEQLKIEEAAKATDKEKWASFLALVNAITLPEFKSGIYKGKLQQYKEKMEEVNAL